jgi:hypothetical protein
VIGHTVGHDGRVASRFDGTVFKLDTGMNRAVYHGHPSALVLSRDAAPTVVYADGDAAAASIPAEPEYLSSEAVSEPEIARILSAGTVTPGAARPDGSLDVQVAQDGRNVAAVFVAGSKTDVAHELAAWTLDQTLGLGIVPATVEREVQGHHGYLQAATGQVDDAGRGTSQGRARRRRLRARPAVPAHVRIRRTDRQRMAARPSAWRTTRPHDGVRDQSRSRVWLG